MRTARIVEKGAGYYHLISRVVGREYVFDTDEERERFRLTLRAVEAFSGTQVLTWVVMSNHFHVQLYVPERQEVDDRELARRMRFLYRGEKVDAFEEELKRLRESRQDAAAERMREPFVKRMCNLADFMKTLKQRVSISYNRRHGRVGTLWEERYKSVLLEGECGALKAVAAYIDLNPVRAGLVSDPKDYRYSGYGEAVGGSKLARAGLGHVVSGGGEWGAVSGEYRQLLYVKGEARGVKEDGSAVRPGFSMEQVASVVGVKGRLSLPEVLRCRVRYFTDGLVLGRKVYVDEAFRRHRRHFSAKRQDGARTMQGAQWGDLFAARALRVDVIGRMRAPA
jgi:REP element-mobilizing transposase RayT